MPRRSPGARAKGLGAELREARKAVRMTLDDASAPMGLSKTILSRLENGQRNITPDEVSGLLAVYGVTGQRRDRLMSLSRSIDEPGWWDQGGGRVSPRLETLIDYETSACEIIDVAPWLIPGLLQTQDFSRAWMTELYTMPVEAVDARVTARKRRQQTLWRPDVRYTAFLGEPALKSRVGTVESHRAQLDALVSAAQRENLTIRVVPDTTGPHFGQLMPFIAFRLLDAPEVVVVELPDSSIFHDEPEQTAPFLRTVTKLNSVALSATESVRLIRHVAAGLE